VIFKERHGHLVIPATFVIPIDDLSYPEIMRGTSLGRASANIRKNHSFREHKEKLLAIGLPYCGIKESKFGLIYECFKVYYEENGHLNIPRCFIVPSDSDRYPRHSWDVDLGMQLLNMKRLRKYKEFVYKLADFGCVVKVSETLRNKNTVSILFN
jgi:hypothetical protein